MKRTVINTAALALQVALFWVFIAPPVLAACAILDCLGIIKEPAGPMREELTERKAA
jgi:hypothetical protein